ncbi:hypothetical protein LTR62_006982 [Meristemomyces frigidus]|uniref:Uncharacterized protein n=1 Tax=Meristemomyces frigidus TaxID=1508187 RepID=A0AAN7TCY9_9PEZI|nr:hypothetical protein LTR62_006982 [Meristemomyces frigidus]
MDGLVLFEACLSGKLHHVPRRPHDRERSTLIKSGSIFIYEENASGIKRWTDGVAWSPSRILGNFLIYRELEKPFPPGEKKRAIKRKRTSLAGEPYPRRDSDENEGAELPTPLTPPTPNTNGERKSEIPSTDQDKELERSLIGSLVDSYGFRPDGLVKKTMSVSVNGISHHMVSYYKVDDVKNSLLPRPLTDPRLQNISVRPDLYLKQNFRAPVEETEHYAIDNHMHAHPQSLYSGMVGGYGVRPGQYMGQPYTPIYGMQPTTAGSVYPGMSGASWPGQQASAGSMPYGNRGYASQSYASSYYPGSGSTAAAAPVKPEEHQQSAPQSAYGGHYASSYGAMQQRNGSQSTPTMMQSQYTTPVQQATSSFGSMSAHNGRASYGPVSHSPSTHSQPQPSYTTAAQQPYAVRSPVQAYNMHHAPPNPVAHSPHPDLKSPISSAHHANGGGGATMTDQMPYRTGSYSVQAPHSGASNSNAHAPEMNGLGISGSGYQQQQQQQQGHNGHGNGQQQYQSYGAPGQGFRGVGDHGGAVAAHYAQ